MKNIKIKDICELIPHIAISLTISMIILKILDWYNPFMNFQFNDFSQFITNGLYITVIANVIYTFYLEKLVNTKRKEVK